MAAYLDNASPDSVRKTIVIRVEENDGMEEMIRERGATVATNRTFRLS